MSERRELVSIRAARPEDGSAILGMLADLASFEAAALLRAWRPLRWQETSLFLPPS